jgi:hypothetical protein
MGDKLIRKAKEERKLTGAGGTTDVKRKKTERIDRKNRR